MLTMPDGDDVVSAPRPAVDDGEASDGNEQESGKMR
jgi:hypothetical protein